MHHIKTAADLNCFLNSMVAVSQPTVDKIIFGAEATRINKIGTCWIASMDVLRKAVFEGVNIIITHEPTFYSYADLEGEDLEFSWARKVMGYTHGDLSYLKIIEQKKEFMHKNNLVIIRCHDVMDREPTFGMSKALAHQLELDVTNIVASDDMYHVYAIEPDSAINITKRFAKNLKIYNLPGIQFYGDKARVVRTVGIGAGCFCDPIQYMEYQADYYITINDSIKTWVQTQYSKDSGLPMAVIGHSVAEEAGMRRLASYLDLHSGYPCIHFTGGCDYDWIE
ncbi:NGG1p interacting factor NIF3 [Escherichia coli]|nr:NGG1p interacting factor NIF3 [Escherichia coli]